MSSPPERALLALLLTALATPLEASVDASAYDAFWLWSATRHQPVLEQASTLYLHQGEILDRPGGSRFVKLGRVPSPLKAGQVWLVVRVNALPSPPPTSRCWCASTRGGARPGPGWRASR
ncbi:hypothetical protein RI837_14550 [Aeromonas caviae]|uniref:hypothetical protein n=1 Tax=Aeromonas caviae TaxID=648 RepID=UPI0034371D49